MFLRLAHDQTVCGCGLSYAKNDQNVKWPITPDESWIKCELAQMPVAVDARCTHVVCMVLCI